MYVTYGSRAHLSEELEMFLDGERIKENVVLWTEAQALSHLAQIVLDVMAVDDGIARRRLDKT